MSQQSTQTPGGESRGTTKNGVGTTNNPMHYEPETFATSNQDLSHSNQGKEKTSRRLSGSKKSNSRRRLVLDFFNELDGSLVIVGVIVFVGDTSRGVLFPVLSTLNTALNGTTIDLGYLVAMFSIGRLVVTAPLGYVSDKYRHKLPLLLSSLLLVVGAVLWGNAYAFSKLPLLYLAQFLLGVGSGSLGVTRSFVVEQCEPKKRTEALAIITALQYAGFTVSPILGSWLVTIGDNSSPYWSFALPAYFIAAMAAMCLIALLVKFQDIPAAPVEFSLSEEEACLPAELSPDSDLSLDDATKRDNVEAGNARIRTDDDPAPVEPSAESAAEVKEESSKLNHGIFGVILGMFLLNISTKGSISVYETLGAQIGLVDYGMSTVALGALISGSGAMGFCQLLLFTPVWTKYFTDIQLILGGIGVMIAAQLIGLSYGSLPHFGRYVTSVVLMYAIGYPIGHTAVLGAFSKIQKSGPQAAMMGWFATSGSFARILLPIVSGYLDKALDNSPFNIVLFMLTLSYLSVVMLKPQLRKHIEIKAISKTTETQVTTESQPVDETVIVAGTEGKIRIVDTFWSIVTDVEKAWVSLSRIEKAEVTLMAFLMMFSLFELLILSGKFNSQHGYDIGEDLSPDLD